MNKSDTNKLLRITFLVYVIGIAIMFAFLLLINIVIKYEENEKKKKDTIQRYNCSWTACDHQGRHSCRN